MEKSNKKSEIKNIIDDIFKKSYIFSDFKITRLKKKWKEIIGEQLYNHTNPVKLEKNTLFINCDHQGWINTLQFYKKEILDNIKKIFNNEFNIIELKFNYGKINKIKKL